MCLLISPLGHLNGMLLQGPQRRCPYPRLSGLVNLKNLRQAPKFIGGVDLCLTSPDRQGLRQVAFTYKPRGVPVACKVLIGFLSPVKY